MNYCTHELGKLVTQFEETCDCDLAVKSAQQKWVYLLWVIRQKFTYWSRNMSPNITKQFIDRITGILKKQFTDLANFDVTDNYWQQICLPIKHHGCGISDPLLTMHAAFVANTEETIEATIKVLHDAQYLEVMDITKDLPVDFDSINNDIKEYVKAYRDSINIIMEAANLFGEKIDEQRVTNLTRRKKVQHFYYEYLSAAAVKRYEDSITSNGTRHLSTVNSRVFVCILKHSIALSTSIHYWTIKRVRTFTFQQLKPRHCFDRQSCFINNICVTSLVCTQTDFFAQLGKIQLKKAHFQSSQMRSCFTFNHFSKGMVF